LLGRLETAGRRLGFAGIRAVGDIDARNVAAEEAGISTVEFLCRLLLISPSAAKSRIRAARELLPSVVQSGEEVPPRLPATAAGVVDGGRVGARAGDFAGGGETADHWIVHHTAWRIVFLDGIPHVIPPPLVYPGQRPQRNTLHGSS
jgi:hypothetical protein